MMTILPLSLQTTPTLMAAHAALVQDFNPLHLDPAFAAQTPFGATIIHGSLMLNLLTEAVERTDPALLAQGRMDLRFTAPALVGEKVTAAGEQYAENPDVIDLWITRDDGTKVVTGTLTLHSGKERK